MSEYSLKFKDLEEGKVYQSNNGSVYMVIQGLLWSRATGDWSTLTHNESSQMRFKEIIQVSEDEKKLLSLIDSKYKYIARDKDEEVWIYNYKPYKGNNNWYIYEDIKNKYEIQIDLSYFAVDFNFLSWEDEEPTRISDLL